MKKITQLFLIISLLIFLYSCKNCQTCSKGVEEETLCANNYPNSNQFYMAISWQEYLGYTCTKNK